MAKSDGQLTDDSRNDDERWFGGRRWTGYFAVGFVVVLLLCIGILALVHSGNSSAGGQAVAIQPTAPASGPAATSATSAQGSTVTSTLPTLSSPTVAAPTPAAPDAVLPTTAPTRTSWQLVAGQAVPSEPGVGPAHVQGYTGSGYTHTPLGALYAAANDFYRVPIAVSAQADWRTPLAVMVAPGPGVKVLEALRAPMEPEPIGAEGMGMSQLAGFKYVSYTDTDAVVQLVFKDKNGGLHVGPIHMQWLSGDWRVVMTPDGTIGGADAVVGSLSGFVVWQGVA